MAAMGGGRDRGSRDCRRWRCGALDQLWISLTLCFSFATYGLAAEDRDRSTPSLACRSRRCFCLPFAARLAGLGISERPPDFRVDGSTRRSCCSSRALVSTTTRCCSSPRPRADCPIRRSACCSSSRPTLQFLIAVWLYGEPFTNAHAIAFAAIWASARALHSRTRAPCSRIRYRAGVGNMEKSEPLSCR